MTLRDRLLHSSQLPGFRPLAPPIVTTSARKWGADRGQTSPQLAAQTARLDRLGFAGAAQETLARDVTGPGEGSGGAEVKSLVEELGSADAARRALNYQVAQARRSWQMPGGRWKRFRVPGIPGAVGYDTAGPDASGHTVAFALGRFLYVVASSSALGNRFVPSRRRVMSSATGLYKRMRAAGRA